MFRKLLPLLIALLLFAEASLFAISAYAENQVAPPENEKAILTNKSFSDKDRVDNKDGSIELSKAIPNDKDSCFPMLYGEKEYITLDFQNANIRNLFRIISEFSGFNVIFSPEVTGSVNIRIYDMPWNHALEIILKNSALGRECFVKGTVRIANRDNLNKASEIIGAEKKGKPRLLGEELKDVPPVAMAIYEKIQSEYPELLEKMNRFEGMFKNKEILQEMSDENYQKVLENYKDILRDAGEIKMTQTPLQKEYQSIRLTGVILIKKEKVALFETLRIKVFRLGWATG